MKRKINAKSSSGLPGSLPGFLPALIKVFASLVVIGISGRALGRALRDNYSYFLHSCPCKDVLSWDANLRFITVLDQYRDFSHGQIWRGLEPFLDAPTWPAFRSAIALLLYTLHPGGPDTVFDVGISYAFFILLFPSMLYIAVKMSGDLLTGSLVWAVSSLLLFYTREIPAYSLSSMLETQGMFFMAWTIYFLFKHYEVKTEAKIFPRRNVAFGLFLAAQGLFHTKYPYGMMLMLGLGAVEFLRSPEQYIRAFLFSLREHYRGVRRIVLFLFLAVPVVLVVSGHLGGMNLDTKIFKNIIFLIILSVFIDFNYFLYRKGALLRAIVPGEAAGIYFLVFFPSVAWLVIHPDRIQSTIGTQLHLQEQTRSFFISLFRNIFDEPWIIVGMTLFFILALLIFGTSNTEGIREYKNRARAKLQDPLFSVTLLVFMQLLILELLTGNKQLRHIYHLLPSILLLETLWIASLANSIRFFQKISQGMERAIYRGVIQIVLLGVAEWMIFKPANLTAEAYLTSRTLCFTGKDPNHYEPARRVASIVEPGRKYIILNLFHEAGAPLPGSLLSTEMDLMIRMAAGPDGDARNDNRYRWKSWKEFDRVILIQDRCDSPIGEDSLKKRAEQTGTKLQFLQKMSDPQDSLCVEEYQRE